MQHVTSQSSSHAPWPLLAWGARRGRPTALPSALRQHACAPLRFSAWLCCPHYDMHTRLSWRRALRFTPFRARVRVQGACSEPGFSCQHSTDSQSGGVSQDPMQAATGCLHLCHGILRYLISELARCGIAANAHRHGISDASPRPRHSVPIRSTNTAAPRQLHAQLHGISTRSSTASPRHLHAHLHAQLHAQYRPRGVEPNLS